MHRMAHGSASSRSIPNRTSAAFARPVRPEIHLRERPVHPPEVRAECLHDRQGPGALGGGVRAVGEAALHVDLGIVGVRVAALVRDLASEVASLVLECGAQLRHLGLRASRRILLRADALRARGGW
jgi:hypothetical protein